MIYHVLNGDALVDRFQQTGIAGEMAVAREALIDGSFTGNDLEEFWHSRAKYMELADEEYRSYTVSQFEKILQAPAGSEFNLWFEYDLFCQVNMWFVISLINNLPGNKKVFAVYTTHLDKADKQFWNGYGPASVEELRGCYKDRVELNEADLQLGQQLWEAYKNAELKELTHLSNKQSKSFPYIQEVIQAHVDRFPGKEGKGRPEKVLEDIITNVSSDFNTAFVEFWKRESIYGFGDTQLKHIYDKLMYSHKNRLQ